MNRQKLQSPLVPGYALPVLALVFGVNLLAFYGTRLVNTGLPHVDLSLPIDRALPFLPGFVVIYLLAYLQWVVGFAVIARGGRQHCYRIFAAEITAKLLCAAIFLLLPTAMVRPALPSSGGGVALRAVSLLYAIDPPDNLFPSLHCLESWVCFRGCLGLAAPGRWYKAATLCFTLLVFASTVLVKQHLAVDVIAGVAVYEAALWLSDRLCLPRLLGRLTTRRRAHTNGDAS